MNLLRTICYLLTSCGCWQPSLSSPLKEFAYTIYCYYVLLVINMATFCVYMDLVINVETEDEFCTNFYITMGMTAACHKIHIMLINRKNIVVLTKMLESEPFRPETKEESEIREKCDQQARSNAISFAILAELAVTGLSLSGVFKAEKYTLPYRVWLPYNYTSSPVYSFLYAQQVISMAIAAMIHVAVDNFIWGLLMYTYSQIEILECRLKRINEKNVTKQCVRYHNLIYRFATMLNEEFKTVIFIQFATSIVTICMRLYILTIMEITPVKIFETVFLSSTILVQIYIFCWYGNEVKLKSLDISNIIFQLDWTLFDRTTKRDLLMIMMRAMSPIEITSVHVVTVNLESFGVLLKASYSAYSLLQNSQG